MSADNEVDSQMISGSDSEVETPAAQITSNQVLSPPDSQHRSMPPTASGIASSNANGKRPLNTISNGIDDAEEVAAMANGKARQDFPVKTHQASGYTWNKIEDEPGYGWMNKKALDEHNRAVDQLVHRDHQVKNRYGDPFEMADKEQVMLNSLKQQ